MSYIIKFPIDGSSSYICQTCGKFSLTTDITRAKKFDTKIKAENLLKNSLPKTFPHKEKALIENREDTEEIANMSYKKIDFEEFQKDFNDLSKKFRDIKGNKTWLNEKLSEADKKITDVEHFIEFHTFSASEGYKLAKGLKDILKERRIIKNQLKIIEILETSSCAAMAAGVASVKMDKAIKGDYEYTPRVLKEMFDARVEKRSS